MICEYDHTLWSVVFFKSLREVYISALKHASDGFDICTHTIQHGEQTTT